MAVARIYPESGEGGRGKKTYDKIVGFSHDYLSKARAVLNHASDLAESVLSGSVALNDAYEKSRTRKLRNESGRNSLTQSHPLTTILPVVEAQERVYLTVSEIVLKNIRWWIKQWIRKRLHSVVWRFSSLPNRIAHRRPTRCPI